MRTVFVCPGCRVATGELLDLCHPHRAIEVEASSVLRDSEGLVVDCQAVSKKGKKVQ